MHTITATMPTPSAEGVGHDPLEALRSHGSLSLRLCLQVPLGWRSGAGACPDGDVRGLSMDVGA